MRRCLVTGAGGFIGRALVIFLKGRVPHVRCLVRDGRSLEGSKGIEIVRGDLQDMRSLLKATEGVDAVIHLAAVSKARDRESYYGTNTEGTENLIRACLKNGVHRFVYVSSVDVKLERRGYYGESKLGAELAVKRSGLSYTIIRPAFVYGRGNAEFDKLAALIRSLPVVPVVGSGDYRLQPVYVDDLVRLIYDILASPASRGKTYEAGGSERVTFGEFVDIIAEAFGKKVWHMHVPSAILVPFAWLCERVFKDPFITTDQLARMEQDRVSDSSMGYPGFRPTSLRKGIREAVSREAVSGRA